MLQNSSIYDQAYLTAGALLDQKLAGDNAGRFFVARYQRGYRWGGDEVRRLLDDDYSTARRINRQLNFANNGWSA